MQTVELGRITAKNSLLHHPFSACPSRSQTEYRNAPSQIPEWIQKTEVTIHPFSSFLFFSGLFFPTQGEKLLVFRSATLTAMFGAFAILSLWTHHRFACSTVHGPFSCCLTSDVELYLTALCRSGNKLIITALLLETKYGYCNLSFRLGCLWFKPSSLTCSLTREILVAVLLCHVPSHEEANLIKMETLP